MDYSKSKSIETPAVEEESAAGKKVHVVFSIEERDRGGAVAKKEVAELVEIYV